MSPIQDESKPKDDPTTQSEIEKLSEIKPPSLSSSTSVENNEILDLPESSDENLETKLLKKKEELSQAMDKLAQAKTEVQKAKQDLISAEADSTITTESCAEIDLKPEESSNLAAVQLENQLFSEDNKDADVSASVNMENNSNLDNEPLPSADASETCDAVSKVETTIVEPQKQEEFTPEKQLKQEDNQHVEESRCVPSSSEDNVNEAETGGDESLLEGEIFNKKEPEHHDEGNSCELGDDENGDDLDYKDAEEGEEEHSDEDEDVVVEGEREEGDGEESENAAPKPLDDDEDRRNPQYIPKRGGFYEHDDRTREEGEEIVP